MNVVRLVTPVSRFVHRLPILAGCVLALAAAARGAATDEALDQYRKRMQQIPGIEVARVWIKDRPLIRPAAAQQSAQPPRESLLVEPTTTSAVPSPAQVLAEIPDPIDADRAFEDRMRRLREWVPSADERVVNSYRRVIALSQANLQRLRRPEQVRLSLAECVQRAVLNNYAIRSESYGPAIARTNVVQAEAAFDALFFLETSWANQDRPSPSQLGANQSDTRSIEGGFRALLPTGMQVRTALSQSRGFTDLTFQTINPAYQSDFTTTFTQPLLRGFGLDYNRAPIELRKLDLQISQQAFEQQVRDRLLDVERTYWQLSQARRNVLITAETSAQNQATYENTVGRITLDATPVEVNNALSRWKNSEVRLINALTAVRDAEDQLKNLMNDPDFLLSRDVEIITTEVPAAAALAVDQFAAVRTALDNRDELRQLALRVEQARVATARAKNETLPQLNVNFTYTVEGLGNSGDSSFDNLTTNRFRSYTVSVNLEMPIGNRRAESAYQGARMQESQSIVNLQRQTDTVVQEVNQTVRDLADTFQSVPASFDAVIAAERSLRSLQARTESISPSFLQTELTQVENLGSVRSQLLQIITNYNIGIAQLERAKGTLLEYNNVAIRR